MDPRRGVILSLPTCAAPGSPSPPTAVSHFGVLPHAPTVLRLDCAKTTARYLLKPPKPQVTVERGPTASPYLPEWRAKISAAVKIGLARRRERLSALAAADAAHPAVSNG
jgi:hypothetical protein